MAAPLHSNCIIRLSSNKEDSGIEVTVDFANFLSLEMERIWGDSANKFTLKLLDKSAYEIEAILLKGTRNIYMRYYVNDGNGDKNTDKSKEFAGNIWDYSVDFINNMTILTITGTCGVCVEDMYTLYNRLWNKVPVLDTSEDNKEVLDKLEYHYDEYFKKGNFIIGTAKTDNDEYKYRFSFEEMKDGSGNQIWLPCTMINVPMRPSDIVKLLVEGGSLFSISPFGTTDIDYDDFADSGFNFGTADGGSTINWTKALEWYNYYKRTGSFGSTSTGLFGLGQTTYSLDSKAHEVIVSLLMMSAYFQSVYIKASSEWEIGAIEKTEAVCTDLSQVKMSNTRYISEVLAPKSITQSSSDTDVVRANYYLTVASRSDSTKKARVYFRPADINAKPTVKVVVGQYYNSYEKRSNGKTYEGDMVLSYSYTSNVAAYIAGESSNELAGINYTTGESINTEGYSNKFKENLGVEEAAYDVFVQGEVPTLSGISSTSVKELVSVAQSDWTAIAMSSFKAEVQLVGNVYLECGDYIEIINVPGGAAGKHHTSGVYLIIKIKETISKGTYVSTLTLVKNAASSGSGITVNKGSGSGSSSSSSGSSSSSTENTRVSLGDDFVYPEDRNIEEGATYIAGKKVENNTKTSSTLGNIAKAVTTALPVAIVSPSTGLGVAVGTAVVSKIATSKTAKTIAKNTVKEVALTTALNPSVGLGVKVASSAVKFIKSLF